MTHARDEAHLLRHGGVGGFGLDCAARIKRSPSPYGNAARRGVHMSAERALVGFFFFLKTIRVIAEQLLRKEHIDLALVLVEDFFPTNAARVWRGLAIIGVEGRRILLHDFGIARPV